MDHSSLRHHSCQLACDRLLYHSCQLACNSLVHHSCQVDHSSLRHYGCQLVYNILHYHSCQLAFNSLLSYQLLGSYIFFIFRNKVLLSLSSYTLFYLGLNCSQNLSITVQSKNL
jgi:hypothetical protein